MSADIQEWVALGVVAVVGSLGVYRAFLKYGAEPMSIWLLNRGRVKWAMWLRRKHRRK